MPQHRLIDIHPLRARQDLCGVWDFQRAAGAAADPRPPRRGWGERQSVPGAWECTLAHAHYRGRAWYRRRFRVDQAGGYRLVFCAVSHTATVWLDGTRLGGHYGGHTRFEFVLGLEPGEHELCVLVDNTFGPHNPLTHPYQDIYTWGGITRPVFIEALPAMRIAEASAVPVRSGGAWRLDVRVRVLGGANGMELPVTLDGRAIGTLRLGRGGTAQARLRAGRVREWSCADPALSMVRVDIPGDAWQERIGFRSIAVKGRTILLNGRPTALVGVNRHEFHPHFGPAVPVAIHLLDIDILKKLGANYVRGAHYPNDELWLDLCDEHGLLFWDELSHWQPKEAHLKDPAFLAASLAQADEMVAQHRHHPSIFTWGFLNECDSHTAAARPVVRALAQRIRRLDPTRPVTYATLHLAGDRCLDLVDIVSLNAYPGWYAGTFEDLPERLDALFALLRRRSLGKPVIISEFGGGAMRGVRSFEPRKWTEDYQGWLIDAIIARAQASGFITGVSIWQYCDVRTSRDLAMGRIREHNNKGIVTEFREPKDAFRVVQQAFIRPWAVLGRRRQAR